MPVLTKAASLLPDHEPNVLPNVWGWSYVGFMSGEVFDLSRDPAVKKTIQLKIGAGLTSAIGREHVIETAIADLIDNSVGHSASRINVRFQELKGRVTAIRIRDDGVGMDLEGLHEAMEMSPSKRKNKPHPLSMFGQGLKSSSMSQARVLGVFTSPSEGEFYGAKMIREDAGGKLEYAELFARDAENGYRGFDDENTTGTVIEWSSLENVSQSGKQAERQQWLSETISRVAEHLGLVFHRYLQSNRVRISIDVLAEETGRPGAPTIVKPIDPFGFDSSGHEDFPLRIERAIPKLGTVSVECFIIPPGSRSENARIMGRDRSDWQGLYVYWQDRLVHFADWAGLATAKKEYSLARVRVNLTDRLREVVTMNPAKKGVVLKPTFATAVSQGLDPSGLYTFDTYLSAAREQLKSSNQRVARATPITRVGAGLPEEVTGSIERTLGWRDTQHTLNVGWGFLPQSQLFDVDFENRLIRLNSRHRVFLSATEENRHEDAPIVRTLLFLLLESYFKGGHLKQQTRDQIKGFQDILAAATELQLAEISEHERDETVDRHKPAPVEQVPRFPAEGTGPAPDATNDVPTAPAIGDQVRLPEKVELPAATLTSRPFPQTIKKSRAPIPSSNEAITEKLPVKLALELATYYRKGRTIGELASEHQISERAVAYSLAETVFGSDALEDDSAVAFRHGAPWDPEERDKMETLFKKGATVTRISLQIGRTPFAIAWKLLDRPEGVEIPNSKLMDLRHRWSSGS
jgi:hypothetical protein